MDKLWAPWRSSFIKSKRRKGCIFCIKKNPNKEKFIIKKTKYSYALLNIYPYNNGHIMVCPYAHIRNLKDLSETELLDLIKLVIEIQSLLEVKLKPSGFNIGINVGSSAGAGYKNHLHIHIVPRWIGDANFMPVTGDTRIVSQSLKELYKLLKG